MTATLGLAMPLMILGWGLVILIGGVVAFSVYAILAGNREEKQYKSSALPETEMMQELKASAETSKADADSLESVDLDSMPSNAPLPAPVATPGTGAAMSGPALPDPGPALPGPAVPDLGIPGPDRQWPAAYAGPTGAPQAMPLPDLSMPGAQEAPQQASTVIPPMPTLDSASAASMAGTGDVLSTLNGMIDSAGAGSGQAAAPVNPFNGR